MYKASLNTHPAAFHGNFRTATHKYLTAFLKSNHVKPKIDLIKNKYGVSFPGPFVWNTF